MHSIEKTFLANPIWFLPNTAKSYSYMVVSGICTDVITAELNLQPTLIFGKKKGKEM
jgi:hypothetical protein